MMMDRQQGNTSKQMMDAQKDAVFIWVNWDLSYPLAMRKSIGRSDDLQVVGPSWLINGYMHSGITDVIVDHRASLTESEIEGLGTMRSRLRMLSSAGCAPNVAASRQRT